MNIHDLKKQVMLGIHARENIESNFYKWVEPKYDIPENVIGFAAPEYRTDMYKFLIKIAQVCEKLEMQFEILVVSHGRQKVYVKFQSPDDAATFMLSWDQSIDEVPCTETDTDPYRIPNNNDEIRYLSPSNYVQRMGREWDDPITKDQKSNVYLQNNTVPTRNNME